jgi:hypothetical protein
VGLASDSLPSVSQQLPAITFTSVPCPKILSTNMVLFVDLSNEASHLAANGSSSNGHSHPVISPVHSGFPPNDEYRWLAQDRPHGRNISIDTLTESDNVASLEEEYRRLNINADAIFPRFLYVSP